MREPANYKLRDIVRAIPACAVLIVISFAVLGCSKKSAGTNASGGETTPTGQGTVPGMRKTWGLHAMPGSVFHVEYSPETSIVDLATVGRTLRGVSADHRIFLFEDSPELRAKLVPGKFVLFEGLDLRKVDALALYKGQLVVGTETAPLNEALKSAQVQLKTSVNFGDLFKQVAAEHPVQLPLLYRDPSHYWWNTLNPVVHADISPNNMEGEFEYADQDFAVWKIHYHFYVPGQGEKIHVDLQIKREANGLDVDLSPKVEMSNFIQQWAMNLNSGNLTFDFRQLNMDTDVDYEWTIKTSENKTPMNEVRFKIPWPAQIKIPLMEETMLPMSVQISAALLFHPAFTTKEEVAKGGFHLKYTGDEGFKFDGKQTQIEGQGEGDGGIDQSFAFSPFASFGLVVAMAVPRVELRMGTDELWDMAEIPLPSALTESLSDVLLNNTIAGKWIKNQFGGNPLEIEGAAYLQTVISTTAAHSGMQSLVPCQQFTMNLVGQAGVDTTWLGKNSNIKPVELFKKDLVQRNPDSKICGGDK
ncbi:MAG TPA: hypothetical protein VFC10_05050 [Terriglobia bacterium]|nr:hypothetical protein [Terriglobia bacterium]